jgi:hypothetical protein
MLQKSPQPPFLHPAHPTNPIYALTTFNPSHPDLTTPQNPMQPSRKASQLNTITAQPSPSPNHQRNDSQNQHTVFPTRPSNSHDLPKCSPSAPLSNLMTNHHPPRSPTQHMTPTMTTQSSLTAKKVSQLDDPLLSISQPDPLMPTYLSPIPTFLSHKSKASAKKKNSRHLHPTGAYRYFPLKNLFAPAIMTELLWPHVLLVPPHVHQFSL